MMKVAAIALLFAGAAAFQPSLDRRAALAQAGAVVAAPLVGGVQVAHADVDYAGLPYLGGSSKIDINNANVRVYSKLPGMYPTVAGKITTNGPYKTVSDVYSIKGLSEKEKSIIKKYEPRLVALEPSPMYVIDRINNGLYR